MQVEFERSVRILSMAKYLVDDVGGSFRVLFVAYRGFFVWCRRVLGWRCVRDSIIVDAFGCPVSFYDVGPVLFS